MPVKDHQPNAGQMPVTDHQPNANQTLIGYVLFTDSKLFPFLKKGFRHCFLAVQMGNQYIIYEKTLFRFSKTHHVISTKDLLEFYKDYRPTGVEVLRPPHKRGTCVSTILSALPKPPNPKPQTPNPKPQTPNPKPPNPKPQTPKPLRSPWVITPYQLYKALTFQQSRQSWT